MKIYTNNQNRICDVHNSTDPSLREFNIPDNIFDKETTVDLMKCYSCEVNRNGDCTIQLLIPSDMAEQINQSGLQRIADQKIIESQLESIVENDQRLSILELGL